MKTLNALACVVAAVVLSASVPLVAAIQLATVASGLSSPLLVTHAGDGSNRLFIVERGGVIKVLQPGASTPSVFLDITSRVVSGGEQGLLGLAFHPQYAQNGRFFVNYTDRNGDTHIAEFRASSNPDVADPTSERLVLFVRQPFDNHNGGGLAFGNDGLLYIALGDGGSGGDPQGNGQSLSTLLGKMLRIDVNQGSPYGIPADNPFASRTGAREVWSYGLRNPWRFAFDRATGDLYIGDVGQGAREEVDVGLASRRGGENWGWNVMEGTRCFRPSSGCNTSGLELPAVDYDRSGGSCAVTGGVVYRGCRLPGYAGTYFYADYCSAFVRSFRLEGGRAVDQRDWTSSLGRGLDSPTAFGVDADGEAYIVDRDGELYRIVPAG